MLSTLSKCPYGIHSTMRNQNHTGYACANLCKETSSNMNETLGQVHNLIQKYEKRLEAKKQQVYLNPNDCVEGIIVALEQVIADLKEISK